MSGRTRTSGLDAVLQLAMLGVSAALGVYYVSQMLWISGAFALANAGLLVYGIKQFIGFAELRQDLLLSAQESLKGAALSGMMTRLQRWAVSRVLWLRFATLQAFRACHSPRHALLGILLALDVFSPALAAGDEPSLNRVESSWCRTWHR